jgi:hypothetical protein
MDKPRCQIIFEQSIRSEQTRKVYLVQIEKFKKFTHVQNMDELLNWSQNETQEKIEDYVIYLKGFLNPNSFAMNMTPIFFLYDLSGITINKTRIKKMYPARIKAQGFHAYTRDDISSMLSNTKIENSQKWTKIYCIFNTESCLKNKRYL